LRRFVLILFRIRRDLNARQQRLHCVDDHALAFRDSIAFHATRGGNRSKLKTIHRVLVKRGGCAVVTIPTRILP